MKISRTSLKNAFVETIALLYILLFVYAAVSKLLDFKNFQVQLGQSPLLSAFAKWVAVGVPVIELSIVLLLGSKKFKTLGLYFAYSLMAMFTAYIYILLNFSAFVPCSCGGILEDMTWGQHLAFNILFLLLAGTAILLATGIRLESKEQPARASYKKSLVLLVLAVGNVAFIYLLFNLSEEIIHYDNNFTRRYPQHAAWHKSTADLNFNSYYFAGASEGKLYLGNFTTPLKILVIDTSFQIKDTHFIKIEGDTIVFRAPKIRIVDHRFYLYEGTRKAIYSGTTNSWLARRQFIGGHYFSLFEPIDTSTIALRYFNPGTSENLLGIAHLADTLSPSYANQLLEKQIDGIFDTDGTLKHDVTLQRIVYTYLYRNEFIVTDDKMKLLYRGNTIDTISKANIKLTTLGNGRKTFARPPLIVNKATAVSNGLLFVNSALPGQFDSEEVWKKASIIDVYDLKDGAYRSSFPIYDIDGKKINSFIVYNNYLYALIDDKLVRYGLRSHLTAVSKLAKN